ncbi:hypothetical protein JHK82_033791 [Glycine max]|nr:hypothetical protein JHK82_033791 [Glycine max]
MFNFPEPPTTCTHELWPETIAVHLLKNQEKWIRTLNYFNVTHGLKPSKLRRRKEKEEEEGRVSVRIHRG